jgi:hypothetical protein
MDNLCHSDEIVSKAAEDGVIAADLAFAKQRCWVEPEIVAAAPQAFERAISLLFGDSVVSANMIALMEQSFTEAFCERLRDLEFGE